MGTQKKMHRAKPARMHLYTQSLIKLLLNNLQQILHGNSNPLSNLHYSIVIWFRSMCLRVWGFEPPLGHHCC